MLVDIKNTRLRTRPLLPVPSDALRRLDDVFFVGGHLPPQQTLETIFESDCRSPAGLFVFSFAEPRDFQRAETLVKSIKRNFRGFLFGQFRFVPSHQVLEQAYAAGIDFVDIPFQSGERADCFAALHFAKTVFPRWSTLSSLSLGERLPVDTLGEIEALLADDIVPLVVVDHCDIHPNEEAVTTVFEHLAKRWRNRKANIKPLLPLVHLATPLVPQGRKGIVHGLLDKVVDAKQRTAFDLRRMLRVREVAESFQSAGL